MRPASRPVSARAAPPGKTPARREKPAVAPETGPFAAPGKNTGCAPPAPGEKTAAPPEAQLAPAPAPAAPAVCRAAQPPEGPPRAQAPRCAPEAGRVCREHPVYPRGGFQSLWAIGWRPRPPLTQKKQ